MKITNYSVKTHQNTVYSRI